MNRFKRLSLAYALQVFVVIIIFGYPGCSSNMNEQKIETGKKAILVKKKAAMNAGAPKTPAAVISLKQHGALQTDFSSFFRILCVPQSMSRYIVRQIHCLVVT